MEIKDMGASLREAAATPALTDPTARAVLDMLSRAERAIDIDPRQARVLIGQALRLLEPTTATSPTTGRYSPELAPWQEREVMRHIGEHLDQTIRVRELAGITGLSLGHFSRCFKGSFGVSPRHYVIRSRLERAKILMRSESPLSQIALDSGFSDQAHMSRLFHAIVGSTPTRWRRAQASGVAA